jgi:hypothetical protein
LQARKLMVMTHLYYTDPARYSTVHKMNHDQANFSFEALVKEVENDPILKLLDDEALKLV